VYALRQRIATTPPACDLQPLAILRTRVLNLPASIVALLTVADRFFSTPTTDRRSDLAHPGALEKTAFFEFLDVYGDDAAEITAAKAAWVHLARC
jgi:hypothetical protein